MLQVVQSLGKMEFTLADVYARAGALSPASKDPCRALPAKDAASPHKPGQSPALHSILRYVRDKIRQQLQVLRDLGLLTFLGNGGYRLT